MAAFQTVSGAQEVDERQPAQAREPENTVPANLSWLISREPAIEQETAAPDAEQSIEAPEAESDDNSSDVLIASLVAPTTEPNSKTEPASQAEPAPEAADTASETGAAGADTDGMAPLKGDNITPFPGQPKTPSPDAPATPQTELAEAGTAAGTPAPDARLAAPAAPAVNKSTSETKSDTSTATLVQTTSLHAATVSAGTSGQQTLTAPLVGDVNSDGNRAQNSKDGDAPTVDTSLVTANSSADAGASILDFQSALQAADKSLHTSGEQSFSLAPSTVQAGAPGSPSGQVHVPVGPALAAMPNHQTMVAAPEDVVDIFTSKIAGSDRPDKITVQLDPPELGRVSIEFKFDAQGLQHVSVTGDTPEAMKRLRLMHFDLVQSLEQNGLTARDMSFSQNTSDQRGSQLLHALPDQLAFVETDEVTALTPMQMNRPHHATSLSGGINLKL